MPKIHTSDTTSKKHETNSQKIAKKYIKKKSCSILLVYSAREEIDALLESPAAYRDDGGPIEGIYLRIEVNKNYILFLKKVQEFHLIFEAQKQH